MADERVRIEIAFEGGQVVAVLVTPATADELTLALSSEDIAYSFDADDGHYTVALRRVVYVKRFARESRVGFGTL